MELAFEQWMQQVDAEIYRITGLPDSDGIPDYPYRTMYEYGKTPRWTAQDAVNEAKNF